MPALLLVRGCPTCACLSYLCMLVLLVVTAVACTGPSTTRSECMHSPSTRACIQAVSVHMAPGTRPALRHTERAAAQGAP